LYSASSHIPRLQRRWYNTG